MPSQVYVVLDGSRVVGVSARLQGAENIRADAVEAWLLEHWPKSTGRGRELMYRAAYDRMRVETHEVQDDE